MNGAGKGSRYRPVDRKKFGENFDRIFGKGPESEANEGTQNKNKENDDVRTDDDKSGE